MSVERNADKIGKLHKGTLAVRIMEKADIPLLAKMYTELFRNPPWNYEWVQPDNMLRYFEDMYLTPHSVGYTLLEDGIISGACFGVVSDYFLTVTYDIKEIFIAPSQQNRGRGSFLLSEIEKILTMQGIGCISLSTVSEIAAYPFYLKNGYSVSETSVFMSKLLT